MRRAAALPALLLVLVGSAVLGVSAGPREGPAYAAETGRVHRVFTIRSPQITESSSLAVSTVDPHLVYTTNDSGDAATVYVLDSATGVVVGRTTLAGAAPLDVEAIAVGTDGSLVVADIGDNDADHSTADLYRIPQPGRGDHTVPARRVDLTYPGGPRDAESVLYDASTGRAYVVSKLLGNAKVYATPPHVFRFQRAGLRPVADAPVIATDATFLPGGGFVVIRTYVDAFVYAFPSWKRVTTFDLPAQQQGESIAAPPSGDEVWVGSEGVRSPVLAVPLPALSTPSPSPSTSGRGSAGPTQGGSASAGQTSADSDDSGRRVAKVVFVVAVAALALLVVTTLAVGARRRFSR